MNFEEAEKQIEAIRRFYVSEIKSAIERVGTVRGLCAVLGHGSGYINNVLDNNTFSGLRKTVKEIIDSGI